MRKSPRVTFLLLLPSLLAVASASSAPELLGPVPVAGECPFPGTPPDPDGTARRLEVSRATALLTSSHRGTLGTVVLPIVRSGVTKRGLPHVSFVDDEILGAMEKAGIRPAALAPDTEFLRRVSLDLTGRIPDAAAVTAFLNDTGSDKRARKIDELLASDAFDDRWALFLDDLARNTFNADTGKIGFAGRNALHAFFVDSLRSRKPYDQMVRELLTSTGITNVTGAPNFLARNLQQDGPRVPGLPRGGQDTLDNMAASVGTAFLGTNAYFCTSCHNGAGHMDSINAWGAQIRRQDFWGLSAFFSRLTLAQLDNTPGSFYYAVADKPNGDYPLNTTTGNKTPRQACTQTVTTSCWNTEPAGLTAITPQYLVTNADGTFTFQKPGNGEPYRMALGRLLTSDLQFARATVNYVWKELFTLGLVEPADSFDLLRLDPEHLPPGWAAQPTHPVLLDRLARQLQSDGFDLRKLMRLLTTSSAYQLSSSYEGTWSEAYTPYFARHFVRRLGAEMLYDAITKATATPVSLPVNGYGAPVAWAVQLPDVSEPGARGLGNGREVGAIRAFLDAFGRGDRDGNTRTYGFSVTQALALMNDETTVTNRVRQAGGLVDRLVKSGATPEAIVDSLFLASLSRPPGADERAVAVGLFASLKSPQTKQSVAEDLQFALLNKLDFFLKY